MPKFDETMGLENTHRMHMGHWDIGTTTQLARKESMENKYVISAATPTTICGLMSDAKTWHARECFLVRFPIHTR